MLLFFHLRFLTFEPTQSREIDAAAPLTIISTAILVVRLATNAKNIVFSSLNLVVDDFFCDYDGCCGYGETDQEP